MTATESSTSLPAHDAPGADRPQAPALVDGRSVPHRTRFGALDIEHDATIMTPRTWTVAQSRWAAEWSHSVEPGRILELCCGAGHIGLEAARLSGRSILQIDMDADACWFARRNLRLAGLGDCAEVLRADLRSPMRMPERFPLIVADPPCVPTREVAGAGDDPHHTIDGGTDGTQLLVDSLVVVESVLTPLGVALVQIRGARQAAEIDARIPTGLLVTEIREHDRDQAVMLVRRSAPAGCDGAGGRRARA